MVAPVPPEAPTASVGGKGTANSPLRTMGNLAFWLCCRWFPRGGGLNKEPLLKLSRWAGRRASGQKGANDLLVLVLSRWPSSLGFCPEAAFSPPPWRSCSCFRARQPSSLPEKVQSCLLAPLGSSLPVSSLEWKPPREGRAQPVLFGNQQR